jgi:4,5-DOPA dioxygenase extradiol
MPLARRSFLKLALAAAAAPRLGLGAAGGDGKGTNAMSDRSPRSGDSPPRRMPVLFVGHGSPMNAIEDNVWSRRLRELGKELPKPKAVLAVSAHWYVAGTFTTANERPETIHDFGGFPEALYRVQYPAHGKPDLARRAVQMLGDRGASTRADWGLDHGTWTVLVHLLPSADVPVVQLSIDGRLAPAQHLEIGRALSPLRDEGVLILGSGNIVHNLRHALGGLRANNPATPEWAREFDARVTRALSDRDSYALTQALDTDAGRLSQPTPDHYLPLLYVAGASTAEDPVGFPVEGFDLGSLSMRAVRFG